MLKCRSFRYCKQLCGKQFQYWISSLRLQPSRGFELGILRGLALASKDPGLFCWGFMNFSVFDMRLP